MSPQVDGAAILGVMARNPSMFGMAKPQLDAIAIAAVRSSLRDKTISLAVLRSMADAIGYEDFETIVAGLPAKDIKQLARIDGKHPDAAAAGDHWHRAHILKLARGDAEPGPSSRVPKILRSARAVAASPAEAGHRLSKIGKIMASQAQATATRARKQRGRR